VTGLTLKRSSISIINWEDGNYCSRKSRVGSVCWLFIDTSGSFNSGLAEFIDDGYVSTALLRFEGSDCPLLLFDREIFAVPKVGRHLKEEKKRSASEKEVITFETEKGGIDDLGVENLWPRIACCYDEWAEVCERKE
jgi:hypothetical protein